MRLLSPLFALGAALALVPILLHLFGRDRAPRRAFPAARLLLAAQQQRAPRARLEQWLLVALRTLAIAAIALVLSRPIWERRDASPLSIGMRQAAVLVIDDSLSMQRRSGSKSLYARARAEARDLARAFPEGSELAVLGTSGEDPLARLERDRGLVQEAIDGASGSARFGATTATLARAAALLGSASLPVRHIYLFSDRAAHGFDLARPRPFAASESGIGLTVVPIGEAGLPNDAIVSVEVLVAAERGARGLKLMAQIRSDGRAAHRRTIALLVDGKTVARGLVELPQDGTSEKRFEYVVPRGEEPRWVELALDADREDALALDDRRAAAVRGGGGRLIVVDGAPGTSRREDETFYVETALRAARGATTALEIIGQDELARVPLDGVAAVLLCNPRPSPALAALVPFVEHGGGLFISVGDNLDSSELSKQLQALLPSAIEGTRDLSGPGGVAGGALRLARPSGPLLEMFPSLSEDRGLEAWRAARTFRVALFRPMGRDETASRVLARFEDGTPALLDRRVGAGRVVALATTADRGWSDLAIQPVFPAFVLELTDLLGRERAGTPATPLRIGARAGLTPPAGSSRLEIIAPDTHRTRVVLDELQKPDGAPLVLLPGRHRVMALDGPSAGPAPLLDYYGETDPAESDPTVLPAADQLDTPRPAGDGGRPPARELWHALAAVLLALLLGEALLSLRG